MIEVGSTYQFNTVLATVFYKDGQTVGWVETTDKREVQRSTERWYFEKHAKLVEDVKKD